MSKIQKTILTVFLFVLSFTPLLWFPGNSILLGYDNVYPLNPEAFLRDRIFSWSTTQGLGVDQSGIQGSLPIHIIDALPLLLGASPQLAQKIVFSLWFFLLLLSSYIFILALERNGFIKNPYLRYIFPILYVFNFYILQAWWIAERTKFSLVVATPLILSIIFPFLRETLTRGKILKASLICTLILSFFNGGGWAGLSLYGGLLVVLGVFYIFACSQFIYEKKRSNLVYLHVFFAVFAISFLLLNAYTFLPFLATTLRDYKVFVEEAGGISGLISWAKYISESASFLNLMRLQGIPDLYNNGSYHPYASFYFQNPILILGSFLEVVLLFLSFLNINNKLRHRKILIFFLLLLLLSLPLTAGIHRPMGFIFESFMRFIPGFIVFRSPIFKFGYAYWFAATFLIAFSLNELLEYFQRKLPGYFTSVSNYFLPICVVCIILSYHFPYFTGDIFRITHGSATSRVEIPPYVYDFSKWWMKEGKGEKILLLPKLNEDSSFEHYTWGYLSLFPILGNLGNQGLVQNSDLVTPVESDLIHSLYDAINNKDFEAVDTITSILGIKYFLIRRDFLYKVQDQLTDDPVIIEKNLVTYPDVHEVATFGLWSVYKYKKQKPGIFTTNSAVAISGDPRENLTFPGKLLTLDGQIFSKRPEVFSDTIIYPPCISCPAQKQNIEVTLPKPQILLDSDFYPLIEIKNRIEVYQKGKKKNSDEEIFSLMGDTLKMLGQIDRLISQGKRSEFIILAANKYMGLIAQVSDKIPNIIATSPNPYVITVLLQQYLEGEEQSIGDLEAVESEGSVLIQLHKMVTVVRSLSIKLQSFYSKDDFYTKKIYKIPVLSAGVYSIKIKKNSLGVFITDVIGNLDISLDGKKRQVKAENKGDQIDLGEINLSKGSHVLALFLPQQQNLISSPFNKKMLGRKTCFSYYINNISLKKFYRLEFKSQNNEPNLLVLIDDGKSFAPHFISRLPLSIEFIDNTFVIKSDDLPSNKKLQNIRLAFCSSSLTEEDFKNNIRNVSFKELTEPQVILSKKEQNSFGSIPEISHMQIDQTKYVVDVKQAKEPFFLLLTQRFSPGWQTNVGESFKGNGYQNVWFIDNKGDFKVNIDYKPQEFFDKGILISLVSFFVIIGLIVLNKDNEI